MTAGALDLDLERTYRAPAQAVFDAWTSEAVLRRWFYGQPGWDVPEATVDLRVGGEVRVVMRDPQTGVEHGGGGRYTELDPPRRLAFTWLWDDSTIRTIIELDLEESADGLTTVRFRHRGLWDEEAVRSHTEGWTVCLNNLELMLEGPQRATNARTTAT